MDTALYFLWKERVEIDENLGKYLGNLKAKLSWIWVTENILEPRNIQTKYVTNDKIWYRLEGSNYDFF